MQFASVASTARREGMLRANRNQALALAVALAGSLCQLTTEAWSQAVQIDSPNLGDITAAGTIKGAVGNFTSLSATGAQIKDIQIDNEATIKTLTAGTLKATLGATLDSLEVTKDAEVKGSLKVGGSLDMTNGIMTGVADISGTGIGNISGFQIIEGGTLIAKTGLTVQSGDINVVFGKINMNGGSIENVGSLTANIITTDHLTTGLLTSTGKATLDSLEVTKDAEIKGKLTVEGNAEVKGKLTVSGNSELKGGADISNHLTVAPATTVSMGGNRVQDVASPIFDTDAANKAYVDAGLAKAFKEIDRNTQGIAIALAMGGLSLPDGKNFALGANIGFFEDKQAIAVQAAIRLSPNFTVNGGFGTGLQDTSTVGARVGFQAAW